jgi:hypothetical protein
MSHDHWHGGSFIELSLDTPVTALAPSVDQATRSMFAQFEGARISHDAIEEVVRRVLQRR